jgi:hypothetical protein
MQSGGRAKPSRALCWINVAAAAYIDVRRSFVLKFSWYHLSQTTSSRYPLRAHVSEIKILFKERARATCASPNAVYFLVAL